MFPRTISNAALPWLILLGLTLPVLVSAYDERNFTCLAPFLKNTDTEKPTSMDEAFLGGPWQFPELPSQLDAPMLATGSSLGTFTNPVARAAFKHGLTLVHLFDPAAAERAFRYAVHLEPTAPAGFWGLALANQHRPGRAAFFTAEAQRRLFNRPDLDGTERRLIASWNPEAPSVEALALASPEHIELRALHLHLVMLADISGERPIANRLANDLHIATLPSGHPARALRLLLWRSADPAVLPDSVAASALELTKAFPKQHQAWQLASDSYTAAGNMTQAIETGANAVRLQPFPPNPVALIERLIAAGRVAEATNLCQQLIAMPAPLGRKPGVSRPAAGVRLLAAACFATDRASELITALRSPTVTQLPIGSLAAMHAGHAEGLALLALDQADAAAQVLDRMKADLKKSGARSAVVRAPAVALREALAAASSGSATNPAGFSAVMMAGSFLARATAIDKAWRAGNKREAMRQFTRGFEQAASGADDDLPVLERLDAVAAAMRRPNWRVRALRGKARPRLDLGWSLPLAPPVRLHRSDDTEYILSKPERPLILNFFVGIVCPECLIQLTKTAPHLPALRADGIDFLSVTPNLPTTLAAADLPFDIHSDTDEDAFRSFGAHDDFGARPLHATILISPKGQVLWSDVSEAPFAQPEALHREAKRLLGVHGFLQ